MPQKGSSHVKGHLYVKFEVKFPETMDEETLALLNKMLPNQELPNREEIEMPKDALNHNKHINDDNDEEDDYETQPTEFFEEVEAHNIDGEPDVTPASAKSAYDEDEEEQGEGVQCRHM